MYSRGWACGGGYGGEREREREVGVVRRDGLKEDLVVRKTLARQCG